MTVTEALDKLYQALTAALWAGADYDDIENEVERAIQYVDGVHASCDIND